MGIRGLWAVRSGMGFGMVLVTQHLPRYCCLELHEAHRLGISELPKFTSQHFALIGPTVILIVTAM